MEGGAYDREVHPDLPSTDLQFLQQPGLRGKGTPLTQVVPECPANPGRGDRRS